MTDLTFSVIIPTYNRAHLLRKTVASAIDQKFKGSYEIIVVDDGSTDETESYFMANPHPLVRYHKKENGERGQSRNTGVSLSKGRYITFLDSDDLFYPDHLENAASYLQKDKDIFWIPYEEIDSNGLVRRTWDATTKSINQDLVERGNMLSCHGVFIKREIIKKHPFREVRSLSGSEDYDLWLRLAARYDFHRGSKVSHALVHHDDRSVYNFKPEPLIERFRQLKLSLQSDSTFMNVYGHKMHYIESESSSYIALHGIMSNEFPMSEAFKYFLSSLKSRPMSLFRKRTLGFGKQLLKRLF